MRFFIPFHATVSLLMLYSIPFLYAQNKVQSHAQKHEHIHLPTVSPRSAPLQFQRLSLDKGLSQSSVHAILQDSKGFLWVGTQEGLNKYDGYKFTVYRAKSGDSTMLSNSWVLALCEDKQGNIWIGTKGGGLNCFNRRTNSVTSYQTTPGRSNCLSSNFVNAVYQDRSGALWIGTDNGLNRFDAATGSFRQFLHDAYNQKSLSGTFVFSIAEDADGQLWVGTDYGLNRFNPRTQEFESLYFEVNDSTISNHINAIVPDGKGRLWLGTYQGLGLFNPRSPRLGAVHSTFNNPNNDQSLSNNAVYSLLRDNVGTLWVGTENGLNLLANCDSVESSSTLLTNLSFARYTYNASNPKSLSNSFVRSLYQDRSGIMWVGTATGGLHSWSAYRQKFPAYTDALGMDVNITLSNTSVRAFYEDEQANDERANTLWIGTDNGLVHLNKTTGAMKTYLPIPGNPASLSHPQVWTIHKARTGEFWIGTNGGGVNKFNPQTGVFTRFMNNPNDSTSLSGDGVRAFLEDKSGTIWVGTTKGLNRFVPEKQAFVRYLHDPANINTISDSRVMCLFEDSHKTLWVGTSDGLNSLDRVRHIWRRIFHTTQGAGSLATTPANSSAPTSISNNWIKSIHEDHDGMLWIATASGLNRFDPQTSTCANYGLANGLRNDYIYGVIEDNDGFLWMGTNQGLAKFDKQTTTFKTYDANDGLQSNEFNTNAFYKNAKGELYFGGINGFNAFVPNQIHDNPHPPTIVLTAFKVFGNERTFDSDISNVQEIILNHNDNFIEFEFAALDFSGTGKNRYIYQLESVDGGWVNVGNRNFAIYTNLDDGRYVFRVKGTNSDGVWSASELRVVVVVEPPFWRMWWFRIGIVGLILFGIFSAYTLRVQSIERQKEELEVQVALRTAQLEEYTKELERTNHELSWANDEIVRQNEALKDLNEEKNEFLGIAAHDLKNPLSRVISLSDMLGYDLESFTQPEIKEFAEMISESSNRMLAMVSNLLNVNAIERGSVAMTIEPVNVNQAIERVAEEYQARAQAKHITLNVALPPKTLYVAADKEALAQILDNLVSNAVKYSPVKRSVWISVDSSSGQEEIGNSQFLILDSPFSIRIAVRDEGPGFSDEDKEQLFQRFAKLSARPTGGENSTGLGLSIVKKLAEAMNGTIRVESKQDTGATFILELPRTGAQLLIAE